MIPSGLAGGSPRLPNLRVASESDKRPLANFRAGCCKRSTHAAPLGNVQYTFVARSPDHCCGTVCLLWHGLPVPCCGTVSRPCHSPDRRSQSPC